MILSGELAREGLRSGSLQQLVDQGMDCQPRLFPWVVAWGCALSRFLGQLYHCLETGNPSTKREPSYTPQPDRTIGTDPAGAVG